MIKERRRRRREEEEGRDYIRIVVEAHLPWLKPLLLLILLLLPLLLLRILLLLLLLLLLLPQNGQALSSDHWVSGTG